MALGFGFGFGTSGGSGSLGPSTSLDLNFVNQGISGGLDSRITFTRSTTASFTGSNGLIQTAAINAARFTYNSVTLAPLGLLIEEQRTNLITYSDQWSNAAWTKSNTTITANDTVSPDGTSNADKLVENSATSTHFTSQSAASSTSTTFTLSCYAKEGERNFIELRIFDQTITGGSRVYCAFDLATGTAGTAGSVGTTTGISRSITPVGNNWYRIVLTATLELTGTTTGSAIYLRTNINVSSAGESYTGNGTSGLYLWGAQLEAAGFETSHIPTVASQVTRSADSALMTGANFSSWYNQSEGTLYAEFVNGARLISNRFVSINDNVANSNAIEIVVSGGGNGPYGFIITATVGQTPSVVGLIATNTQYKTAIAYKLNNTSSGTNGVIGFTDTVVTIPTVTQINIGSSAGGSICNCPIKQITYYPNRLSNAQIQELTA